MRENFPYVALGPIKQPGTLLTPYREGDGVPAGAVENWDLVVGRDVMPVDTKVIPRPDDGASRPAWEAFAIGQGWTPEDARDASMKDLRAVPEPDPERPGEPLPDPNAPPERPDESAAKAQWVEYAVSAGADREWATAKSTTKADLIAFDPVEADPADRIAPTDEVAATADAQTNG